MYKEILTQSNDKENRVNERSQANGNSKIRFNDILCPKNCSKISSIECSKCEYKEEHQKKHELGISLITMICVWGTKEHKLE